MYQATVQLDQSPDYHSLVEVQREQARMVVQNTAFCDA